MTTLRFSKRCAWALAASSALTATAGLAQTTPPPPDPHQDGPATQIVVAGHLGSILGTQIDPRKVPNSTRALGSDEITRSGQANLTDALEAQVGSVSLNAVQGNPYQPDFNFRGFTASPVEGTPIGIAVYQGGVRVNEGFGDTVNWDLVPMFAIHELNLTSANPVFGLNALGGALALQMKSGFNDRGLQAEVSGGSFGRHSETLQYGTRGDRWGLYLGTSLSDEQGWRVAMPSHVRQLYGDLGFKSGDTEIHFSDSAAINTLYGTGPTPANLLAQNWGAGIDYPGVIRNSANLATLSATQALGPNWMLAGNAYWRHFAQGLQNGAPTSSFACTAPYNPDTFCSTNIVTGAEVPLTDASGNPVPLSQGGAYPGENDVSRTLTNAWGGTVQLSSTSKLFGHGNHFIIGGTVVENTTHFASDVLLGQLDDTRDVVDTELVESDGGLDASIRLTSRNDYLSLYVTDTFDLTDTVSLTASAGYNHAHIQLADGLGTALNGTHDYQRLNPSIGATWQLNPRITLSANYSENNRVPTPAELSCADPTDPCNLASFFVADPALRQVVSRTIELGLRGNAPLGGGRFEWNASLYRTTNTDDIISVASDVVLHGYFQNAGNSRRQGADLSLNWKDKRWRIALDTSFLDATFLSNLTLSSPFNPAADANGNIEVHPGDRLPGQPRLRAKLAVDYAITDRWRMGATLDANSSQVLRGDESNQTPPVPGYALVNLRGSWSIGKAWELFGSVNNLFNRRYYTFGTFTTETGLPMPAGTTALAATRTYGPGAPRGAWIGVRVRY
jgi:iron complex outermembrane recepter protein